MARRASTSTPMRHRRPTAAQARPLVWLIECQFVGSVSDQLHQGPREKQAAEQAETPVAVAQRGFDPSAHARRQAGREFQPGRGGSLDSRELAPQDESLCPQGRTISRLMIEATPSTCRLSNRPPCSPRASA